MATVTPEGVRPRSLAEYTERLGTRFREALGADLALEPETPQGQIIGIMALELSELDDAVVAIGNAMSLDAAAGNQIDDLGSPLDVRRFGATFSRVTATLSGVTGTQIPAGSRAKTDDNEIFETLEAAVLTSSGIDVEFQAIDSGPVRAPAGALNIIVSLIAGWEGVTNAAAAVPGLAGEADPTFRARFSARATRGAVGPLPAFDAGIAETLATAWRVEENVDKTPRVEQGWQINANSVLAIVEGGTDTAVSRAVLLHKGQGVGITIAILGGAPDNTTLDGISNGTITFNGVDYAGLDLSGATTPAAKAAAITTLMEGNPPTVPASGVTLRYVEDRYIAFYQYESDNDPEFGDGAVETALGLDPANADYPEGPFMRTNDKAITISTDVTINRAQGFPADGLARMRTGLLDTVTGYRIGQQLWSNDLLCALEAVPGTRVTALTVQHNSAAVSGIEQPMNNRWTLDASAITFNIT